MPKSSGIRNLNSHDFDIRDHASSSALHAASGVAVLDAPVPDAPPVLDLPTASPETPPQRKKSRVRQNHSLPHTFHALPHDGHSGANHQAELFYLQKQIQQQTQMIFIMEDGARIQGVIEWYDRHSIKVRGKSRVLIYKAAIKYLYKAGELGSAPGE
ncbi:MAG TPA: RNA chaperone Hfq [Acidobacteriaceae bacterium]|nr:RNA chaperone Hfq [Acidobacteriaceae bacterium]